MKYHFVSSMTNILCSTRFVQIPTSANLDNFPWKEKEFYFYLQHLEQD